MSKLLKFAKSKLGIGICAVAAVAVIAVVILLTRPESYRTIAVEEINGTTLVSSNGQKAVNIYKGMHLYSGDDVSVQENSDMTMLLDMDKYAYAEPGTHFWLECSGKSEESKTMIYMDSGSTLHYIKDNLNEGEVYQVDTPNSTMAVRGTVFRVTVYQGEDGLSYTLLEGFEGSVQVDLKTEDGKYNGVSEIFKPGEAALIRGNDEFSEFVPGENGIKREIEYKNIPQETAKKLVHFIDDGAKLCIGKELLMDYTQLQDHKMEILERKESTCTEAGYEKGKCHVCDETFFQELPLKNHKLGEWEVTLEATCENVGTRQKVCTECNNVCVEEEIEKLPHTPDEVVILTEATCTENGTRQITCIVCGEEVLEDIPATGHSWNNWETLLAPTCTENGTQERLCSICESKESQEIAATGHTLGNQTTVTEATCTTDGTARANCTVCGVTLENITIPATGHTLGNKTTVTEPTCTTDGTARANCTVCGVTLENVAIPATGHTLGTKTTATEPTCTTAGTARTNCTVCGSVVKAESIPATGHTAGTPVTVSEATCIKGGTTRTSCTVCGETIAEESIAATGHVCSSWTTVRETTCYEDGLQERTCTVCGNVEEQSIPMTDHIVEEWYSDSESGVACLDGGTVWGNCSYCGAEVTRELAPGEHIWNHSHAWDIETLTCTCSELCTVCGEEKSVADGFVIEDSETGERHCSNCGGQLYEE